MNKFKERLNKILKNNGISQTALAQKIGMDQSTISCYCSGKIEPSLDALMLICTALGESADFMLGLIDM